MHRSGTNNATPPRSRDGAFFLSPSPEGRPAPSSLKLLDVGKRKDLGRYQRFNLRRLFCAAFGVTHEKEMEGEGMPRDNDYHWYAVADDDICAVRDGVLSDVCVSPSGRGMASASGCSSVCWRSLW